ncbi:peptidyl-prolyl cis-trans isomerase [Psychrobacillus sp. INOP01]|uniref:peptidyl-prolyl cis-trans isomerase n=1 Tax=Psychrobacillus sp. INOP01 TaxID=2829187 RepID=UPI001BA75643|nr:peptidyl-prolyl cis-trans isomerase [Psychrobacillus sp. INOP01]QUG39923.1 peptidyl-prolyl cis-trans isomerase [Psychrobacillus sp. INOP01]
MKSTRDYDNAPSKRRLKTKPVLVALSVLLVGNLLWFIAWLIPNDTNKNNDSEEVASVAGKVITKEQWMASMESVYGKEVLLDMVNAEVMEAAAKEYKIKVTDAEVDLELALIRSTQEGASLQAYDEEVVRKDVRSRLILEKVLAKDIVIEDDAIKEFYDNNKNLYNTSTSYRTSVIYVSTDAEANEVVKELENGSSFEGLARERSADASSASLGGDIGYVSEGNESVDEALVSAVKNIDKGKWSNPIALGDGRFAVLMVKSVFEGQSFSYADVKGHIRRELALDQLPQSVTQEAFWKEFDADWVYSE